MPCIGGPSWDQEQAEAKREAKLKEQQSRMEPMLCSACRALERLGYDFDENPELSEWWDKHKKADAERLAKEQQEAERAAYQKRVAEEALRKPFGDLSNEEKHLLKKLGYFK